MHRYNHLPSRRISKNEYSRNRQHCSFLDASRINSSSCWHIRILISRKFYLPMMVSSISILLAKKNRSTSLFVYTPWSNHRTNLIGFPRIAAKYRLEMSIFVNIHPHPLTSLRTNPGFSKSETTWLSPYLCCLNPHFGSWNSHIFAKKTQQLHPSPPEITRGRYPKALASALAAQSSRRKRSNKPPRRWSRTTSIMLKNRSWPKFLGGL